jgi:hypothetical protein
MALKLGFEHRWEYLNENSEIMTFYQLDVGVDGYELKKGRSIDVTLTSGLKTAFREPV